MGTLQTPTTTTKRVAANVRAELAARHITKAELATAIGQSRSTVYRWLNDEAPWALDQLEPTAAFLGVTIESLLMERAA